MHSAVEEEHSAQCSGRGAQCTVQWRRSTVHSAVEEEHSAVEEEHSAQCGGGGAGSARERVEGVVGSTPPCVPPPSVGPSPRTMEQ